jgi:thymidine kinase
MESLSGSRGSISVIFGPMFSGKTTELLRRMRRHQIARKKCLVLKYQNDTRYTSGAAVSTHDRTEMPAIPVAELMSLPQRDLMGVEVIGIDEGCFFPDIVPFCEAQANSGKVVIVASLDGTFQRKEFNQVLGLVPLAEEVTKLTAVCTVCGSPASFSRRIGKETAVELIGGADKYIAACRQCFFDETVMARLGQDSPPVSPVKQEPGDDVALEQGKAATASRVESVPATELELGR